MGIAARLRPLRQLDGAAEVVLFVRVLVLAAAVRPFSRLPLRRQAQVLSRPPGNRRSGRVGPADAERAVRVVEAVQHVASPLVRRGCLTRAITVYWLLGRGDADVELCFGMGRIDGRMQAHAWLTREGRPHLERVDPDGFEILYRIPTALP